MDPTVERTDPTVSRGVRRRALLKTAGVGVLGVSVFGAGTAGAETPYEGPFRRTYEPRVVDPSTVPLVSSDPGEPDEGEGEAGVREVPRKAPEGDDRTGGAGEARTTAASGGLVERDFDGLTALDVRGVVPSDNQIAAGEPALFEAINSRVAAFDRSGEKLAVERADGTTVPFEFTLDDWFQNASPYIYEEGDPEREGDDATAEFFEDYIIFDPRARYDADAGRYVLSCVDFNLQTGEGAMLLSVSSSSDPTDPWYNYRVPPIPQQEGTRGLVDYDQLGFDANAIYLTENFFPGAFSQATLAALDRAACYAGEAADATHFTGLSNPDGSPAFTVQPATTDGEVGYFVNSRFFEGQSLTVWRLTDPIAAPTLTADAVRVSPYTNPPSGAEQPDTEEKIDMGDDRVLRVATGDGRLWAAHTVDDGRARWYELDPAGPSVVASGVFRRNGRPTFFPAIESDGDGAAFVYNTSSPSGVDGYVNVEVAGVADGAVDGFEIVKRGENDYDYVDPDEGDAGAQVMRWGDYNGISVDPVDGGYWVVGQYAFDPGFADPAVNDDFYATRIAKVDPD